MIAPLDKLDPAMVERFADPNALIIVLGGTLLAMLAQCGSSATLAAIGAAFDLLARRFDETANRAALARAVSEFVRRGYLCADLPPPPDPGIADALDAYRRTGLPATLRDHADRCATQRRAACERAVRPLDLAGELAPVFGLVGTLLALTELAAAGTAGDPQAMSAAIGQAVLSTLYGVIAANLIFLPLARAIERRARHEIDRRRMLIEWTAAHLEKARSGGSGEPGVGAIRNAA